MGLSSPDIPSRNGSQPSPEGGPDAQTLLGPSASTKPVDLQETLRATMAQFRQIEDSVTAIARQFPESSEAYAALATVAMLGRPRVLPNRPDQTGRSAFFDLMRTGTPESRTLMIQSRAVQSSE